MTDKQIYNPDLIVSVCVVTYNHEKYIEKCIESILNQETDFLFEIIVADDASTDKTLEILLQFQVKYPQRLRVIAHDVNLGPYENYRLVHQQASGVYIAHCDGDDYWLPGKLQKQVDFLEANPDCSAVYSNAKVINAINDEEVGIFNGKIQNKFDVNYLMAKSNFLNHSSMLYRANLMKFVIPSSSHFIDYMIHSNLSKYGLLGYVNELYVVYRANVSGSLVTEQSKKIQGLVLDTIKLSWPRLSIDTQRAIKAIYLMRACRALLTFNYHDFFYYKNAFEDNSVNIYSVVHILSLSFSKIFSKLGLLILGKKGRKVFFQRNG